MTVTAIEPTQVFIYTSDGDASELGPDPGEFTFYRDNDADLLTWNTGTDFAEEFSRTNNADGYAETVKTRAVMPFPASTNLFMNIRVWLQQVPAP